MQTNNKLREALAAILGIADHVQMRFEIPKLPSQEISELKQIAEAALAEPIKNCEVGTAAEQMKRQHDTMCNTTKACPDPDWSCKKCFAEWSQKPYEEGGDK